MAWMLSIWLLCVRCSKITVSSRSSRFWPDFFGVSKYLLRISMICLVCMPKSFASSLTLYLFTILPNKATSSSDSGLYTITHVRKLTPGAGSQACVMVVLLTSSYI